MCAVKFERTMTAISRAVLSDDDSEVSGTDYLAKTVLVSRKIGPIGFIRFKPQTKPKPAPKPAASPKRRPK